MKFSSPHQSEAGIIGSLYWEWETTHSNAIIEKASSLLGISADAVYRRFADYNGGRVRQRKKPEKSQVTQWTKLLWQVKKSPPKDVGDLPTHTALQLALKNQQLPEEAGKISIATYNRTARELGINKEEKKVQRFQARHPNEVHQFDVSGSNYFYVKRRENNDWILSLYSHSQRYKNKPKNENMRVWLYGLTDDHSGYWVGQYRVAIAEAAHDALEFLWWAWGKDKDPRIVFRGIPWTLYMDQGPLVKMTEVKKFLQNCGVKPYPHMPGSPQATGKIERPWRTIWQGFEKQFFALPDWKNFEISLSELNKRFINYILEYNQRAHRFMKFLTKEQTWLRINEKGGVMDIPRDAFRRVYLPHKRKVGTDGFISYKGIIYEVKDIWDEWIWVYEGLYDGSLIAEDMKGNKHKVILATIPAFGQFKSEKEPEGMKIREKKEEGRGTIKKLMYEKEESHEVEQVISEAEDKIKSAGKIKVEDPFEQFRIFRDKDEARREIARLLERPISSLGGDTEKALEQFLDETLDKDRIRDVAMELRGAILKGGL